VPDIWVVSSQAALTDFLVRLSLSLQTHAVVVPCSSALRTVHIMYVATQPSDSDRLRAKYEEQRVENATLAQQIQVEKRACGAPTQLHARDGILR